jgi:hypothetical protein
VATTVSNESGAETAASKDATSRRHTRSTEYQAAGLRIEPQRSNTLIRRSLDAGGGRPGFNEIVEARLADVSRGGLGVETFTPLPLGTLVNVQGELHSVDTCIGFRATAWVVHCLARESGAFRIGLNFERIECWELDCEHEDGFTIDPYL